MVKMALGAAKITVSIFLLFMFIPFKFVKDFSPGSAVELSQLTENVSILTEKDPMIAGQCV